MAFVTSFEYNPTSLALDTTVSIVSSEVLSEFALRGQAVSLRIWAQGGGAITGATSTSAQDFPAMMRLRQWSKAAATPPAHTEYIPCPGGGGGVMASGYYQMPLMHSFSSNDSGGLGWELDIRNMLGASTKSAAGENDIHIYGEIVTGILPVSGYVEYHHGLNDLALGNGDRIVGVAFPRINAGGTASVVGGGLYYHIHNAVAANAIAWQARGLKSFDWIDPASTAPVAYNLDNGTVAAAAQRDNTPAASTIMPAMFQIVTGGVETVQDISVGVRATW